MGRRPGWRGLLVPLLAAALPWACGPDAGPGDRPAGAPAAAPADPGAPARILSLVPSATETLLAMGAADRLVGRTDFDTAAALAALPSVGGGLHPSREVILTLRPDLVVHFASETDVETPAFLDRTGIPHLAVRPETLGEVRQMIRRLGAASGREEAAGVLLDAMDRELAEVRRRVRDRPGVRAAFLLGGQPPYVAGPGSFPHELLELAGGVNAFGDLERPYAPVSPEALVARELDVLLVTPGTAVDPRIAARVPVRRVDPAVELPGPRAGEAARSVARALHPAAFGGGP